MVLVGATSTWVQGTLGISDGRLVITDGIYGSEGEGSSNLGTFSGSWVEPANPESNCNAARWQWEDPTRSWQTYDRRAAAILEREYQAGAACAHIGIGTSARRVDFDAMEVTGSSSGNSMPVRRGVAIEFTEERLGLEMLTRDADGEALSEVDVRASDDRSSTL